MRIFAYILPAYILLISALPCIDKPYNNAGNYSELAKNTSNDHQNESDHCSPFCTCYCCASTV